jgi:hypothetical protein
MVRGYPLITLAYRSKYEEKAIDKRIIMKMKKIGKIRNFS